MQESQQNSQSPSSQISAQSNQNCARKYELGLKIASFICGILLILLGIFSFATFHIKDPMQLILPVYYFIWGIMICLLELKVKFMTENFRAFTKYSGKGLLLIFVGTMCITRGPVFFVIAVILILCGGIYLFCYCKKGQQQQAPQTEKYQEKQEVQQYQQDQAQPPNIQDLRGLNALANVNA